MPTPPTPMGWLDFFASIIGSVAWPGVVLVVLCYNRRRLANLPDWIEELTLPGGTKFKFRKALDEAVALAGAVVPPAGFSNQPVAEEFPETMVVRSFIELVETLGNMVQFLALPTKARDPETVMQELARLGYIEQRSVDLFQSLKTAYTAAVREGYARLTAEEARQYRHVAQVLNWRLREVLPRLEADNPRKKEWGTP
jgi:hypothetical protein